MGHCTDYWAGSELGTFGSRSSALLNPLWHTPTDWAKSLWLSSFSSDWTASVFREHWKQQSKTRNTQFCDGDRDECLYILCNCVYGHALSCTERSVQACHGNAFGVRSRKQRRRKKKLAIYRAWPWISNCLEWDSGLSGLESSALTTRPRRPGANLCRDAMSNVLFLTQ